MGDEPAAVVFVVDDDTESLGTTGGELRKRYGADYDVVASASSDEALAFLQSCHAGGRAVAFVIADLWMPSTTGAAFLATAHDLYPTAKRALLVDWNDRTAREALLQALAVGQADCHLMKPTRAGRGVPPGRHRGAGRVGQGARRPPGAREGHRQEDVAPVP